MNDDAIAMKVSAHPMQSSKAGMAIEMIIPIEARIGFLPLHLPVVLNSGRRTSFVPREHLAMSGDIFGRCNWRRAAPGI